jgi:hemoglobin-like flavoprotein
MLPDTWRRILIPSSEWLLWNSKSVLFCQSRELSNMRSLINDFSPFSTRLFELQPRAKTVFGYDKSYEAGKGHGNVHANIFGALFDSILQLLGPDIEFIEEILQQVGRKHIKMGASPSFFPFMGEALIYAVEKGMGKEFQLTEHQRNARYEVYEEISNEIVKSILL